MPAEPFLYFQIAKAEKLKPLEVELKRLEDLSESIVNDFAYMRAREEEMRDTNGKLIGLQLWALYYTGDSRFIAHPAFSPWAK